MAFPALHCCLTVGMDALPCFLLSFDISVAVDGFRLRSPRLFPDSEQKDDKAHQHEGGNCDEEG